MELWTSRVFSFGLDGAAHSRPSDSEPVRDIQTEYYISSQIDTCICCTYILSMYTNWYGQPPSYCSIKNFHSFLLLSKLGFMLLITCEHGSSLRLRHKVPLRKFLQDNHQGTGVELCLPRGKHIQSRQSNVQYNVPCNCFRDIKWV